MLRKVAAVAAEDSGRVVSVNIGDGRFRRHLRRWRWRAVIERRERVPGLFVNGTDTR